MWCQKKPFTLEVVSEKTLKFRWNFPLRAFSDTRTEIISNRVINYRRYLKIYKVFRKIRFNRSDSLYIL
jgi:hypothetical protein